MTTHETPNASTKNLLKVFRRLRDRHAEMTMLQAMCLLHVAHNEGIAQTDLYDALDSNDSTVSRTLALLSDLGVRQYAGLDLVAMRVDKADRRRRLIYLTPKGRRLIGEIEADLTTTNAALQEPV